ncbi:unnamed protein product [Rhizophagus irregularis]|nr:unnamed protein product [Rhizophagus irregularis]
MTVTNKSENEKYDEDFLKKFSRDFCRKIIELIDTTNLNILENILKKWIDNIDKNTENILESMQKHKENELLFSSIIGFFYQHGIGCIIDKNKALELYLISVNNNNIIIKINENFKESFIKLNIINEFEISSQNINVIIGKFLLSLFYYKDIILDERNFNNYLSSARKVNLV